MLRGLFASRHECTRSSAFSFFVPVLPPTVLTAVVIMGLVGVTSYVDRAAAENSLAQSARLTGKLTVNDGQTTIELAHEELVILRGADQTTAADLTGKTVEADGQWLSGLGPLIHEPGRARVFDVRSLREVEPEEGSRASAEMTTTIGVPAGFIREDVVTGMVNPVGFDFAPDERIFIAQKNGIVRVFENGTLLSTPFIDISAEVNNINDRGLLGIAVHPQFPTLPYIYLLYTYDPPEIQNGSGMGGPDGNGNRVSRMIRVEGDPAQNHNVADLATKVVLLGTNSTFANIGDPNAREGIPSCDDNGVPIVDCIPIDERSHTIGTLAFGTDGSLFVGNGDGSSFVFVSQNALRAQDLDSLAGKIMRIDPITGEGRSDNPFYDGDPNSNRSKVYSYGVRNPFRFTIHPDTGEPFIGDVGWGTWEEINTGGGQNFGWPCYEGGSGVSLQQSGYQSLPECQALYAQGTGVVEAAVHAYDHAAGSSSVQAGAFYKGTAYPSTYHDVLFFNDYNNGAISYITFDASGNVDTVNSFGTITGVTQTIAGPDSNLYYANIQNDKIERLRYIGGGNIPPTAVADADPTSGPAPLVVNFDGDDSFDPDAEPITYLWDFGDGNTSTEANPTHTYTSGGTFDVTLTVTDPSSATGQDMLTITVNNTAPTATITSPANNSFVTIGNTLSFTGTGVDPEEGNLSGASLVWEGFLHHADHTHIDAYNGTGSSGSFVAEDHGDDSHYELCLTVTDSGGLSDTDCIDVFFTEVVYNFDTVPTGLTVNYSGEAFTAPFSVTTYVNGQRSINVPPTQNGLTFESWSNGGPAAQTITIESSPQTLIATYSAGSSGRLQTLTVGGVSDASWTTVALGHDYTSLVVACTLQLANNSAPAVVRMQNVGANSFDISLQNPSNDPLSGDTVHCIAVEEGIWELPDGTPLEAFKYLSTVTDGRTPGWNGEVQAYQQVYGEPVVLGQVMTTNDARWSTFWSRGNSKTQPPTGINLYTGKHVAEDTDTARADETVGYIVFETSSGSVNGSDYEFRLGPDTIRGHDNNPVVSYSFASPFTAPPAAVIASQAAMDGNQGGWAVFRGVSAIRADEMDLVIEEDQIKDNERYHTSEQVAYVAFQNHVNVLLGDTGVTTTTSTTTSTTTTTSSTTTSSTTTTLPPEGAVAEAVTVANVDDDVWTTVGLTGDYTSLIPLCTVNYANNSVPVIPRITNIGATSFDVKLQNPSGVPLSPETLHCLAIEEGKWSLPDGRLIEAQRYVSNVTDRKGSWLGEVQSYLHSYTQPVVLGQVISFVDPAWSVFWSRGTTELKPPSASTIYTGKHVGEDPNNVRLPEDVGFVVAEAGNGTIGGVAYEMQLGPDTVSGMSNGPPYTYSFVVPFSTVPEVAVATQSAMDGSHGGWALLFGASPLTASTMDLVIDEDQVNDSERYHSSEQVAYFVFSAGGFVELVAVP